MAKREAAARQVESELSAWTAMQTRASRMVNRTSEALEARHAFTACNYEVLSDTHLKWAARRGTCSRPTTSSVCWARATLTSSRRRARK